MVTPYKRRTHRRYRWFSPEGGVITRVNTPGRTTRLARIVLVERGRDVAIGTVTATVPPDLRVVDGLLRVRLWAARSGWTVELRDVHAQLGAMLELAGLDALCPLQGGRQAEGGKEVGVEEEVHPGDPVA